jgi:NitT/TauT family transport system permease protein
MPHLFTGLKIGAVGAMAGAITGEFLRGGKGWSGLPPPSSTRPRVFSLVLCLSLLGLALFAIVVWIQRRFVFWHKDRVLADSACEGGQARFPEGSPMHLSPAGAAPRRRLRSSMATT